MIELGCFKTVDFKDLGVSVDRVLIEKYSTSTSRKEEYWAAFKIRLICICMKVKYLMGNICYYLSVRYGARDKRNNSLLRTVQQH